MRQAQAVIRRADGRVVRWGRCDFAAAGDYDPASEDVVDVDGPPPDGVRREHLRVSAGQLVEISPGEKAAADASVETERAARGEGALRIQRRVPRMSSLPRPAPADGLLVRVADVDGAGTPGIAISFGTAWVPFASL